MERRIAHALTTALERVGPAWFTSVMGTGILAIGIAATPLAFPGRADLALALWLLAVALFAIHTALLLAKFALRPADARATLTNPVAMHAWGAPPMAAFTVAVGSLTIGAHVFAPAACIALAQALFIAGVIGSVATAFAVPLQLITTHDLTLDHVNGTWLLAVVPPIVASVPAALLSPFWPAALRGTMLGLAYALLGLGVLLAALVIGVFFLRLVLHKVPAAPLVPATWIVVGPLGQSIAGFVALGGAARSVWPAYGAGLAFAGVAYGVVMWGFALYWLAMAIVLTLRALRNGVAFTLGWWAFTFPVGVLTAGTIALYHATGATIYAVAGIALLALLATMWTLVATRSLHAMWIALDLAVGHAGGGTGRDRQRRRRAEHPIPRVAETRHDVAV
jgi:C4-dicarboxylate transporter/malic acid transport protein